MTSADALHALERDWPEHHKPMTRADLRRRLDLEAVRRGSAAHDEIAGLLRILRLV